MSERGTAGRGRPNRSRGGLGKYLRARGRGGGRGRPAEFSQRLLLDGEGKEEMTEEEAAEAASELARRFGRRQLGTNADRYEEKEEIGSDGEPIVEPEVDLTEFLEKQKEKGLDDALDDKKDDDDDVDHELAHISSKGIGQAVNRKGKVTRIEWDKDLAELDKDKKAAEAHWGAFLLCSTVSSAQDDCRTQGSVSEKEREITCEASYNTAVECSRVQASTRVAYRRAGQATIGNGTTGGFLGRSLDMNSVYTWQASKADRFASLVFGLSSVLEHRYWQS